MMMKRIEAPSLAEALQRVEDELGKDALVIDTKSTRTGYVIFASPRITGPVTGKPPRTTGILNRLLAPPTWTPGFAALAEAALEFGLSPHVMRAIENALIGTRLNLSATGDPALPTVAAKVLKALIRCVQTPLKHRVLAFVGSTGVGKTTTLAKLAAKAVREEQESIAIVTLDTYRVAAVEQLRAFSDMLNVPFEVAFTPLDLRRALQEHADADRIFIDTTGRGPFDTDSIQSIAGALAPAEIESALCVPATLRQKDAHAVVEGFGAMRPSSMIITKWDETLCPGECLSQAIETDLPISYITIGQEVPDDIVAADPGVLAANAMNLELQFAEEIL